MAKKKRVDIIDQAHDHGRGVIQDNHLKALVTSTLFQGRVEPSKKGKGSYQRKAKHGSGGSPANSRW